MRKIASIAVRILGIGTAVIQQLHWMAIGYTNVWQMIISFAWFIVLVWMSLTISNLINKH